jgi:hypothetical protein
MATADMVRATAAHPRYYAWSFPGCPVRVNLALKVVSEIERRLAQDENSRDEQGMLLGSWTDGTTEISGFAPVPAGNDRRDAVGRLTEAVGENRVVGYYRCEQGEGLRLNDGDLSLAQTFFPKPHQVFLLVQGAATGPSSATFFFWDGGRMNGDFCFLDFPFDADLLAATERESLAAAERKRQERPARQAYHEEPDGTGRRSRAWLIAALLGVSALAGGGLAWLWKGGGPPIPAPVSRPQLGLHAERRGGDVALTWDRDAAVVRNAAGGLLSVREGSVTRQFPLEAGAVRAGSILYSPTSEQAELELSIQGAGEPLKETVLVIVPRNGAVQTVAMTQPAAGSPSAWSPAPLPPSQPVRQPARPFIAPEAKAAESAAAPAALEMPPPAAAQTAGAAADLPSAINRQPQAPVPPPPDSQAQRTEPREQQPVRQALTPVPATPLRQVAPATPPEIRSRLLRPVIVEVLVSIDAAGKVVRVESHAPKGTSQFLIDASVLAAQKWTFHPAMVGGQPVPASALLQFRFDPRR